MSARNFREIDLVHQLEAGGRKTLVPFTSSFACKVVISMNIGKGCNFNSKFLYVGKQRYLFCMRKSSRWNEHQERVWGGALPSRTHNSCCNPVFLAHLCDATVWCVCGIFILAAFPSCLFQCGTRLHLIFLDYVISSFNRRVPIFKHPTRTSVFSRGRSTCASPRSPIIGR